MKRLADVHAAIRWLLVTAFACFLLAVIAGCGIVYSPWFQSIGREAGHMWVSSAGCLSK